MAERPIQRIKEILHAVASPFPACFGHTTPPPTILLQVQLLELKRRVSADLVTSRLWVAELAAVLVGVTVSSFLPFSVGEEQI